MPIQYAIFMLEITGAAVIAALVGWLVRDFNRYARRGGGTWAIPSWLAAAAFLCMAIEAVANLIWRSAS